jgi:UDP-glucose 4-epimerase
VRALVTGGAGFIGSTLVDRLLAEGHAVDVVDDLSTGSLANLAGARAAGGALSFHHLDIAAPELADLMVLRRPEVVYHLAGHGSAALSLERPLRDAQVNVLGALRVLDAAHVARCRKVVVVMNGTALFGEAEPNEVPAGDLTRFRSSSPHAAGAHAVLNYLTLYRELHGLEFTALACGDVYGPRDPGDGDGIVATLVADLVADRRPVLFGAASDSRDFVYVDDVVDALSRAGDRGSGLVLNIATGRETQLGELFALLAAALSSQVQPRYAPRRRGEARRVALDPARAALHLDWRPWTGLPEGIGLVLERLELPSSGGQRP